MYIILEIPTADIKGTVVSLNSLEAYEWLIRFPCYYLDEESLPSYFLSIGLFNESIVLLFIVTDLNDNLLIPGMIIGDSFDHDIFRDLESLREFFVSGKQPSLRGELLLL